MKKIFYIIFLSVILALSSSCSGVLDDIYITPGEDSAPHDGGTRVPMKEQRHTFILFSIGHNNLSSALQNDLAELKSGFVPKGGRNDNVLLVFSHKAASSGGWSSPVSPVLIRIYKDNSGATVSDTVAVWDKSTVSARAATIREVLEYVKDSYPSASYGMLLSSHATGYLPEGFYSDPDGYIYKAKRTALFRKPGAVPYGVPYRELQMEEGEPMVKSIGQDVQGGTSYEMELNDFAAAIPMRMSYILFDACLMGGIEVAYALRDKCDMVGFSQAEVLSNGFVYDLIGERLLSDRQSHPELVCDDYFQSYDTQSGVYRSATISLVDCRRLEPLASECRKLFAAYRGMFDKIDTEQVQRFYRRNYHWFYDLESIVSSLEASAEEMEVFRKALADCIIYKAATPSFMLSSGGFEIKTFSGLSMYLPSDGNPELDKYYKTLAWNEVTGLVE